LIVAVAQRRTNYVHSIFFPSAILILSEFRNKADAYFAGLTCYYERLIAERRHRTPVARLYFQQHTFEYTSHVSLDRKSFLAWTAQRSKGFRITLLRDENHQLDLFNDLANDICRHICLAALKALGVLSWLWRHFSCKASLKVKVFATTAIPRAQRASKRHFYQ
jgi:hypothetical protein